MKVTFFVAQPGSWDGSAFRFEHLNLIDFFAVFGGRPDVESLNLCLPIRSGEAAGQRWKPPNERVGVVPLPYWSDEVDLLRRLPRLAPRFIRAAGPAIKASDVVGATLPGLTGAMFLTLARLLRRPTFALVRGVPRRTIAGARRKGVATRAMLTAMRAMEIYGALLIRTGTRCVPMAPGLERQLLVRRAMPVVSPILDPLFRLEGPPTEQAPGPRRLLYVGRLSGEKNLVSLIRALKSVADNPSWTLTIAGSGPLQGELEALCRELCLGSRIGFVGQVSHDGALRQIYLDHDVFILPSVTEGAPRALAEAMGMGLCPIASAVGGIPDMLDGGACGYLMQDVTPSAIAADLRAALEDESGMGVRSRLAWERSRTMTFPSAAADLMGVLESLPQT